VSAVIWGALAFLLFVLVAGLAGFAFLGFRGWRQFKALRSGLLASLDELGESVAAAERRLGSVEGRSAELQRSIARLSRSLAEARLLVGAAREVGDLVGRVRGVVPSK
jgi:hypothetical protein